MANKIPFLWTNDDITIGLSEPMQRQLDFLARWNLKGSFFVVPLPIRKDRNGRFRPAPLTDDPALIALLKGAMRDGHDVQHHTVTHACEENGTADLRMFDLMGDAAKVQHSNERFVLERLWQVDALEAHIGWGRKVWTEAFGAPSEGYRPGCGAFCGNMYAACERLGFKWVSARLVSMTGWMWAARHLDYPIRLEGPGRPFRQGKLIEFPILDDVAFRIPRADVDRFVELGWQLWQKCVEKRFPFLLVSHYFALAHDEGTGYAIHEKLLPRILDTGLAEPMTISEYHRRILAGEFPMADAADLYREPGDVPDWHALHPSNATARR
jgi:peptidoglycan/xylan/chitin deacetylase (PgdA/CDA1 family)